MTQLINSLLNSNPLIDAATIDDERPTPGHVYSEIIKLSYQGNQVCERLCKHIITKLAVNSAAVKLKSLLICQHLLEKGNSHFQKELLLNVNAIRACLDFKGPIDPIRGEAPYRVVREKTQQILNQIYETPDPSAQQEEPTTPVVTIPITHVEPNGSQPSRTNFIGSNSSRTYITNTDYVPPSASGGSGEPAEKKHTGFGSSDNVEAEKTITKKLSETAQTVLSTIGSTFSKTEQPVVVDKGRYVAPIIPSSPSAYRPNSTQPTQNPLQPVSTPSSTATGTFGPHEFMNRERKTSQSSMGLTPEYAIIDALCNPGVTQQANPSRLQLSQFLSKSREESIRMELIYYLLQEQLSNQDWKRKLRALYAIHELIINNVPLSAHYFSDQGLSSLLQLTTSVQKTLQEKAIQIITVISPNSLNTSQPQEQVVAEPKQHLSNSRKERQAEQVGSIFTSLTVEIPQQPVHTIPERRTSHGSHQLSQSLHTVPPPVFNQPQPIATVTSSLFEFPTQQPVNNALFVQQPLVPTQLVAQPQSPPQQRSQQPSQAPQQQNIFDQLHFPNQKSLLGAQPLVGEPKPQNWNDLNSFGYTPSSDNKFDAFGMMYYQQQQPPQPALSSNGRSALKSPTQKDQDPFFFGDIKTIDQTL